ncbi:hypothetical protein BT69DRAFT_49712 [Atractiella rhizophila]|nr:hypothetical protein BT69DRAFT_49712 [Atractiella rhizophila]
MHLSSSPAHLVYMQVHVINACWLEAVLYSFSPILHLRRRLFNDLLGICESECNTRNLH